ncbi:hypothetical protein [Aliivibrio sp. EL58]|uniref:hypothetical protein n=1 Tax=Aliivibrio sp. EL58 TaxID=2107582 RepID=UPI0013C47986|nr:hypothetical protein [Aliivibrio sp. EL58]
MSRKETVESKGKDSLCSKGLTTKEKEFINEVFSMKNIKITDELNQSIRSSIL